MAEEIPGEREAATTEETPIRDNSKGIVAQSERYLEACLGRPAALTAVCGSVIRTPLVVVKAKIPNLQGVVDQPQM